LAADIHVFQLNGSQPWSGIDIAIKRDRPAAFLWGEKIKDVAKQPRAVIPDTRAHRNGIERKRKEDDAARLVQTYPGRTHPYHIRAAQQNR
jgi:hypothetical protein